ncbi:MAG: transporter, partial [Rhizorhabdus sp.]|nr:transporter [Rhizorhabdus sp.]
MITTRHRTVLLLSLTATLLASCAAVPHVQPQFAPLAARDIGLGDRPATEIGTDWWTALGDPQLDRIMAEALAHAPSLDAAMARLRSAEAEIAVERAGQRPQVTADIEETRQRLSGKYIIPPPYGGTGRWMGSAQANLSWTIDFAGRQKALV